MRLPPTCIRRAVGERPLATSLEVSRGLLATLTTFPVPELRVHVTATQVSTGLSVWDSVAVRVNFPPTGPSNAPTFVVMAAAAAERIIAHQSQIVLSANAAEWAPFWKAAAPLVCIGLCIQGWCSVPLPPSAM